jgi:hypothetical protein
MDQGDEIIIPFYANYNGFRLHLSNSCSGNLILILVLLYPIADFEKLITPKTKAIFNL